MNTTIVGYTLWRILMPVAAQNPRMVTVPGGVVYDFATAHTIVRGMYEAFVRMHYLFVAHVADSAERELRFALWERHAWSERRKLVLLMKGRAPDEDAAIAELTAAIEASPVAALARDPAVQRSIGFHGTLKSLERMAAEAGIPEGHWKFEYGLTSNYSHASGFHILKQFHLANGKNAAAEVRGAVSTACPVLAGSFDAYCSIVPEARDLLDEDEETRRLYEIALELLHMAPATMFEQVTRAGPEPKALDDPPNLEVRPKPL